MKNRLKVGQVVSPEFLSEIQLESEKHTALDKALVHISATRKTEKQVRDFLSGKGYLSDVIEFVIEKMKGYNFLNDGEYAEAYIQSAGARKGGRLIKMELKSKGISDGEIDEALSGLDGETQVRAAVTLLQKYLRGKTIDRETLQKAYRYLMSKGFDYDTARSALLSLGDIDEE